MSVNKLRILYMAAASIAIVLFLWSPSHAQVEITWKQFDVGKARAVLRDFAISEMVGPKIMYEWESLVLEAERNGADEEVIGRLREHKRQWQIMSFEMEQQLEEVRAQARRDAQVRKVANILKAVAVIADVIDKLQKKKERESKEKPKEGQIQLRQKQILEKFEKGKWKILNLKKSIILGELDSQLKNPIVEEMSSRIVEWIAGAPVLLCNSEFGGCFEAPDGFDSSSDTDSFASEEERILRAPETPSTYGQEILELVTELDIGAGDLPAGYRVSS